MTGYNLYILREMPFECGNLDLFAGGLSANNGALLGRCAVSVSKQLI